MARLPLLALLVPALAWGAEENALRELMHARDFAMGGAYRAHGLGAEAVLGNPAALGLYPRYLIELSGAWDAGSKLGFGTLAVLDSTNEVAGGASYHLVSMGRGEERTTVHLTTLASALPLSGGLHLGLSGRHALMSGAKQANALTMDAGILFRPIPALGLSFSGHNLVETGHPELSRYYALSAAFLGQLLTVAGDVKGDFGGEGVPRLSYSGGVEYLAGDGFPLRAGYARDELGSNYLSGGIGVLTGEGSLDFGYRQELGGRGSRFFALTLQVRVR